jgi:hypothetical protein
LEFWLAARRMRRDAGRPGWFFLDKIFGGRKVKIVKWKTLYARGKAAEGCRSPRREAFTGDLRTARSVLECASPLALSGGGAKNGAGDKSPAAQGWSSSFSLSGAR